MAAVRRHSTGRRRHLARRGKTFRLKFVRYALQNSRLARAALRLAIRLVVPRHRVGVAGVIFNRRGEVLLVEHVVRRNVRWGLPGGWVQRGEDPAEALRREVREELELAIEIERVILCEASRQKIVPFSIAVAFVARAGGKPGRLATREISSFRWMSPDAIDVQVLDFHRRAIDAARRQT